MGLVVQLCSFLLWPSQFLVLGQRPLGPVATPDPGEHVRFVASALFLGSCWNGIFHAPVCLLHWTFGTVSFPRVVEHWNRRPQEAVDAPSLSVFERRWTMPLRTCWTFWPGPLQLKYPVSHSRERSRVSEHPLRWALKCLNESSLFPHLFQVLQM